MDTQSPDAQRQFAKVEYTFDGHADGFEVELAGKETLRLGGEGPGAEEVRLPNSVRAYSAAVGVKVTEADDSVVVNEAGFGNEGPREVVNPTRVCRADMLTTGGRASGTVELPPFTTKDLSFEIWNVTGGPFKAHVELSGIKGTYNYTISGWSLPCPLWPVLGWNLKLIQAGVTRSPVESEGSAEEVTEAAGSSRKPAGRSPKSAPFAKLGQTVEGELGQGEAGYYKVSVQQDQAVNFTVYGQIRGETSDFVARFAVQDEEGGKLEETSFRVDATGEDYNRETLRFTADEDGTFVIRIKANDEAELGDAKLGYRIKLK